MRFLVCLCVLLAPAGAFGQAGALQLKISVSTPVVEPLSAQITLHFHNAGQQTLWLYEPARDPSAIEWDARFGPLPPSYGPAATFGAAQAGIHLEPAAAPSAGREISPARGLTFEPVGFPHPKVLRVPAGGDAEETIRARLRPAVEEKGGKKQSLWGSYKLSVNYQTHFSNTNELERILGVRMWQGELRSNAVAVELAPPPAANRGSITGTLTTADERLISDALVSLSNRQEQPVGQTTSGPDGNFAFHHLPPGFYWVTARRRATRKDSTVFDHAELTPTQPSASVKLVMLAQDIYKAKQLLHKPVFILITDPQGHPISGVRLHDVWTTGTVLDDIKTKVPDDGLAIMQLIPGSNYMTVRRHGCKKEDRRVDVAPGGGVDGSKLVLECRK